MSVPYALYAKNAGLDSAAVQAMINAAGGSGGLGNVLAYASYAYYNTADTTPTFACKFYNYGYSDSIGVHIINSSNNFTVSPIYWVDGNETTCDGVLELDFNDFSFNNNNHTIFYIVSF